MKALVEEKIVTEDIHRKIIVTGQTPTTPIEISAGGLVIYRHDL